MELQFPFEFVVYGTPVSHQGRNAAARDEWKDLVAKTCQACIPDATTPTFRRIGVTLFYFPDEEMTGDIDNIVKYTLDGLNGLLYQDDKQIERVAVQKFEPRRLATFTAPSRTLLNCVSGAKPALYIRITQATTMSSSLYAFRRFRICLGILSRFFFGMIPRSSEVTLGEVGERGHWR